MRVRAITVDSATARRPQSFYKRWASCPRAMCARVQWLLATQKHRYVASVRPASPRPNNPIVMLVESDLTGGRRGMVL